MMRQCQQLLRIHMFTKKRYGVGRSVTPIGQLFCLQLHVHYARSTIGSYPSVTVAQFLKTPRPSSHHNGIKFVVAWLSVFTQDGWSAFSDDAVNVDLNKFDLKNSFRIGRSRHRLSALAMRNNLEKKCS